MAARITILFLSFVVLSLCNVDFSGNITLGNRLDFVLNATNFQEFAYLTVTPSDVVVCIQELYPTPGGDHFSNETCTFWFNMTSDSKELPLGLRNIKYHIGVYFANTENLSKKNETLVKVSVSGPVCGDDLYGPTCLSATALPAINESFTTHFTQPETQYFTLEAPSLLGSLSIQPSHEDESAEFTIVRMRYSATPSSALFDANDLPIHFVSPRPGKWVISVEAIRAGDFTFNLKLQDCAGTDGAGEGCATKYQPALNNMTLVAFPGVYTYFKFVSNATQKLMVSVTTEDHKDIPHIYVTKGNIPRLGNADISNCNQNGCDVVRSIFVNETDAEEVWFIGVTASVTTGNTTYGIWYNTTCPPECEFNNHGSCNADGTCECQIDFKGIDCTTSKGWGAQYIVLIIIACLVVTSAIIGFVAWAYMRRKRVNYELVS